MNTSIPEQLLLQGSWYSLEQSGRLLTVSTCILESGDSSTALAIGMFAREELGRSRILRDMTKRVREGESLCAQDVWKACKDHTRKQISGALSTSLMGEKPSQVGSPSLKAKTKRQSDDRHDLRQSAIYVDLNDAGTGWLRPQKLIPDQCRREITEAVNDYAGEFDRLRDEVLESDFPEMAAARKGMNPMPILPPPRWPRQADQS